MAGENYREEIYQNCKTYDGTQFQVPLFYGLGGGCRIALASQGLKIPNH